MRLYIGIALLLAALGLPARGRAAEPPLGRDEAISLCEQTCHAEADDPASEEYRQCTRALATLETLAAQQPDGALLAALVEGQRNRDANKAKAAALQLLSLEPESAVANAYLAMQSENPVERLAYLERAAASAPDDAFVHGSLAVALLDAGQIERAVTELERQLAVNPDATAAVWRFLDRAQTLGLDGVIERVLGRWLGLEIPLAQKCRSFVDFTRERLRERPALLARFLEVCGGEGYYELGVRADSVQRRTQLLRQAVKLSPAHLWAHGELAVALAQGGDGNGALAEMERQIDLHPGAAALRLPELAQALGSTAGEGEIGLVKRFLVTAISDESKCRTIEEMGRQRYRDAECWPLIVTMCGPLWGLGHER